jgi:hypothetical protein
VEESFMSLSMYDVSVPVFRQILTGMSGVLEKAQAHCEEAGVDHAEWTGGRLADDMFPFSYQILLMIVHSAGAVALLRGEAYPHASGLETFAGCRAAVVAALAYLDGVKPEDLAGSDVKDVVFTTPSNSMPFVGRDYLLTFAAPNFYFHASTAYDILRHKGLGIGKRDFLGPVKMKAA